jgi:hypothetical protein
MLSTVMTGGKQISLLPFWAERLNDEHIPYCLSMIADNGKIIS